MTNSGSEERGVIRQYLLGELGEEKRERFEERFITDREFKEQVLLAEDALVESYLNDELSEEDRQRFRTHFLSTPQQVQKLQIAQAVNRYFSVEAAAHSPPGLTQRLPPWLTSLLRPERRSLAYAGAGLLVLCAVVVGWLAFQQPRSGGPTLRVDDAAFARELERLNRPGAPPSALTVVLLPGSLRGSARPQVVLPERAEAAELLLVLPTADEYRSYRVVLRKLEQPGEVAAGALKVVTTGGGSKAVSLKLPARLISHGDYNVTLGGLNADDEFEPLADYSFTVPN
jgi:hypothetical protein